MRQLWHRSGVILMGLALVGCASLRPPGLVPASGRTVTLQLQPSLEGSRQAQAVVSPYTAASIQRLDVVPHVEAAANIFQPISATTGLPTTDDDPQLLKVSQSAPTIDFNRPIVLSSLKPNKRYRIFARAYASNGALISTNDAYSYAEVALTHNDRPTMAATLPLKLVDRPFSAATSVTLSNSGGSGYDYVAASLVKVVNGSEVAVSGATQNIPKASIPKTLQLAGLSSNTTYRLKVSARKSDATEVATAMAVVAVGTNDAPTAQSVAFSAPVSYTVSTYLTAPMATPYGIARDAAGCLYVANYGANNVIKVFTETFQQFLSSGLNGPSGIAVDASGNLYVSEDGSNTIQKITPQGARSLFASGFNSPWDLAIDAAGNLYVADAFSSAIKKVTPFGSVSQLASIPAPNGVAVDANGTVYASDANGAIAKISPGGSVSTLASGLNNPAGLAVDSSGNVFVAVQHAIKCITPAGAVTTVAGADAVSGLVNGAAPNARFNSPIGVVLAPGGVLYVTDSGNHAIRKIVP